VYLHHRKVIVYTLALSEGGAPVPVQDPPTHRNSIGYAIGQGRSDGPKIVWGLASDGARVWIGDAAPGASGGLNCECGTPLVAKRGAQRAHHFAHIAGSNPACADATNVAAANFIAQALSGSTFRLPILKSRFTYVRFEGVAIDHLPSWICLSGFRVADGAQRNAKLLFKMRAKQSVPEMGTLLRGGHSAMLIDLSPYRHHSDDAVRAAILRLADRRWIHNDRYPNAVAEEAAWRKTAPDHVRSQLPQRMFAIPRPSGRDCTERPLQPLTPRISTDEVGRKLFPYHWRRT
jgi:hypothetical protein